MKLYLDDVNFDTIKKVADIYPIDGITSNPSVLKKSGKTPVEQLRSVREFIGQDKMLMSQVVSTTAEDMIKEARVLKEIIADEKEEKYFVKLPANPQGIKAIRQLAAEGMRCNATAIYDVTQGYVALEAGAKALAPSGGRAVHGRARHLRPPHCHGYPHHHDHRRQPGNRRRYRCGGRCG